MTITASDTARSYIILTYLTLDIRACMCGENQWLPLHHCVHDRGHRYVICLVRDTRALLIGVRVLRMATVHDGYKSGLGVSSLSQVMSPNAYAQEGEKEGIALRIQSFAGVEASPLPPRCSFDPDGTIRCHFHGLGPRVRSRFVKWRAGRNGDGLLGTMKHLRVISRVNCALATWGLLSKRKTTWRIT